METTACFDMHLLGGLRNGTNAGTGTASRANYSRFSTVSGETYFYKRNRRTPSMVTAFIVAQKADETQRVRECMDSGRGQQFGDCQTCACSYPDIEGMARRLGQVRV